MPPAISRLASCSNRRQSRRYKLSLDKVTAALGGTLSYAPRANRKSVVTGDFAPAARLAGLRAAIAPPGNFRGNGQAATRTIHHYTVAINGSDRNRFSWLKRLTGGNEYVKTESRRPVMGVREAWRYAALGFGARLREARRSVSVLTC